MGEHDMELGIGMVFVAAVFLLMGLEILEFQFRIIHPGISTVIAVAALAYGVYLITKSKG